MRRSALFGWFRLAGLIAPFAAAPPARAEDVDEPDRTEAQAHRNGVAVDATLLALRLSDVPLVMLGGGAMGVIRPSPRVDLRLEPGAEVLVGHTREGLGTTYLSATCGVDVGFSLFHVAPTAQLGLLFVSRASGSPNELFALAPSLGLRLGPEFRFAGRNHLSLDLAGRLGVAGGMLLAGFGGGVRYGFF